ncbi:MAG: hypothetical protein PVG22_04155 [Chromatiales bacterium]|jgi:hypothetical protein
MDGDRPQQESATSPGGNSAAELTLFKTGCLHAAFSRSQLGPEHPTWFFRRLVVVTTVLWLPLLLLSALDGVAFPGQVGIPFVYDLSVHTRLFIVIPLFLCADVIVEPQLIKTQKQFLLSGLIRPEDTQAFARIVRETGQLARSWKVEIAFLMLVVIFALLGLRREPSLDSTSWLVVNGEITAAGSWFYYACIPVYQFILFTWFWRYIAWTIFIWRVSRLDLYLTGSHPDRTGGLGFIGIGQASFVSLVVGFSIIYSSAIAKEIVYDGAELIGFLPEITILMGLFLIIFLTPLLVFSPQLVRLRVSEIRRYSAFSGELARRFSARWNKTDNSREDIDRLLGSSEVDRLANLTVVFGTIKRVRVVPVDLVTALTIALATFGPMVPLVLTVYSPTEILSLIKSVVM